MKKLINISDALLAEALTYSDATDAGDAVRIALEEYVRRQRVAKVSRMFGTFKSICTNDEIELA